MDTFSIQQIHCSGTDEMFLAIIHLLFLVHITSQNSVVVILMFHLSQDSGNKKGYEQFDSVLTGILRRILDTKKRVQEAACSAFATLEEVVMNLLHELLVLGFKYLSISNSVVYRGLYQ